MLTVKFGRMLLLACALLGGEAFLETVACAEDVLPKPRLGRRRRVPVAPKPVPKPAPQPVAKPQPMPVAKPVAQPARRPEPPPLAKPAPQPVARPEPKPVPKAAPAPWRKTADASTVRHDGWASGITGARDWRAKEAAPAPIPSRGPGPRPAPATWHPSPTWTPPATAQGAPRGRVPAHVVPPGPDSITERLPYGMERSLPASTPPPPPPPARSRGMDPVVRTEVRPGPTGLPGPAPAAPASATPPAWSSYLEPGTAVPPSAAGAEPPPRAPARPAVPVAPWRATRDAESGRNDAWASDITRRGEGRQVPSVQAPRTAIPERVRSTVTWSQPADNRVPPPLPPVNSGR